MLKGLNYSQYLTKSRALLLCLSSLVFVSVFSSGCSNSTSSPGAGVDPNRIVVLGSDTMEELVRTWANGFMTGNPGIQVTVSSGDTGVGIKDLIEGKIDVASASRELTEAENKLAHEKKEHLTRVMVARDSIAVIVNPQNKLEEIGLDDLRRIYKGEIKTWDKMVKELKVSEPIRVFGREATSGTSSYFHEHIMTDATFDPDVKLMPSSEAVIGGVFGNRLAIGFVGMSQAEKAADKVKILKLALHTEAPDQVAKESSVGELSMDNYPLSRPLYLFFKTNQKERIQKFIDYTRSEQGRKAVHDMGFMPIP